MLLSNYCYEFKNKLFFPINAGLHSFSGVEVFC